MQKLTALSVSLALVTALASPTMSLAKSPHSHGMHKKSECMGGSASTQQFKKVNMHMHKAMDIAYTGDPDVDFVSGMIPHHQGAIDMAQVELQYGKNEDMRELAEWIIRTQMDEIAFMKTWLDGRKSAWRAPDAANLPASREYQHAMHRMHQDMDIDFTGDADVDFARGMIAHHKAAIAMATTVNRYGKYPHVIGRLADGIFNTQSSEVRYMEKWLAENPSKLLVASNKQCHKQCKKHKKKK